MASVTVGTQQRQVELGTWPRRLIGGALGCWLGAQMAMWLTLMVAPPIGYLLVPLGLVVGASRLARGLAPLAFVVFGGLVGAEVLVLLAGMFVPGLTGAMALIGWCTGMATALAIRPHFIAR